MATAHWRQGWRQEGGHCMENTESSGSSGQLIQTRRLLNLKSMIVWCWAFHHTWLVHIQAEYHPAWIISAQVSGAASTGAAATWHCVGYDRLFFSERSICGISTKSVWATFLSGTMALYCDPESFGFYDCEMSRIYVFWNKHKRDKNDSVFLKFCQSAIIILDCPFFSDKQATVQQQQQGDIV